MNLFRTEDLHLNEYNIGFSGMTEELFSAYVSARFAKQDESILIVTPSLFEANKLYNTISNYTNDVFFFTMDDFLTSEASAKSPDLMVTRLETLNTLVMGKRSIVVTHLMGYLHFLPSVELYRKSILHLKVGEDYDREKLVEDFYNLGYVRETLVTQTGEVGVRGFVLDIFPVGEEHPVRLEFFGDTIDSIRIFDEETQKSLQEVNTIDIYTYSDFLLEHYQEDLPRKQKYLSIYNSKVASIFDYMDDPVVIFKDYSHIESLYQKTQEETFEYRISKDNDYKGAYFFELEKILPNKELYYFTIDNYDATLHLDHLYSFDSREVPKFNENIEALNKFLKEQLDYGRTIVICLKDYQRKRIISYLEVPYVLSDLGQIEEHQLNLVVHSISQGFYYGHYVFLAESDIYHVKEQKKIYKTKFKYASKIKDINKLEIGDYVVHNVHGIGVYNGIRTLTQMGLKKDYLEVLYQGKDKLYIPVEKIDLISKYSGNEGTVPKINKLSGTEWQKTKLRVRGKIKDIAEQLLRLYAQREMQKGYAFSKDTELQIAFEHEFPYTETKDQLLAIEQIKQDMERPQPMDRLLCGDVGYGKTEVAFRAAFKAICDSKQVLYLCPTTILSSQQYDNAKERFQHFPVSIGLLNRFTSPKEVKRVLNGLKAGTIDFVFGTHRILSDDIMPKDLGLLIIDEEQRFGVVHKEKIKKYKANVDVLTLTATPIPRTLQMSLVGIRSLSLIETPPVNRYPVQTYVVEESKQVIRDAIYKELSRDGQVFLLYNRVEDIERKLIEIQMLVPDASIVIAHGQMNKSELEEKMMAFIHHEYDILLCTTIIETGIDIPNVNTLIILDADRFGLSQLYQIRGRVGRSNKIAYAYLMYQKGRVLTETAVKRLNVIKEFTELGSGFSIATRDLSIRGAGDILGSEQAGFIDTIGIDLYLKMLNDEVMKLKGEIPNEEEVEEQEEKPFLAVETHIADNYVFDTDLKIEIHKKINEIDSYDKLKVVKEELEDRFGQLDEVMTIYMYEEWFEKLAKQVGICQVRQTKNSIELIFNEAKSKMIDGEKLFLDAFRISPMFRFSMRGNCLSVILDTIKLERHYVYYLIDLLQTLV